MKNSLPKYWYTENIHHNKKGKNEKVERLLKYLNEVYREKYSGVAWNGSSKFYGVIDRIDNNGTVGFDDKHSLIYYKGDPVFITLDEF